MRKKTILIALIIVVLIAAINLPPIKWFIIEEDVLYSNATGSFTFDEMNYTGRDYDLCMRNFQLYKTRHGKDTVLYRLTSMRFWKVWHWGDYLTKPKYKLPYKSWNEIEVKRGDIETPSNFQNF